MEKAKVNTELYLKIKEAVESGDYTVDEAALTLDWLRVEYMRKRSNILDAVKVNEIKNLEDWYDEQYHKKENAPELN